MRGYQPPRVTVLIGCWNNAGTLRQAIDSILGQTISDLELVVVDDGSIDGSRDLVAEVERADERVRCLPLAHMGISRSLNRGLEAARAEIVAFQDADDWSLPDRIERELELLDARPEVAVVGCRMREVDEAGRELAPRTSFRTGDVNEVLLRFNPIPNSCAMLRRGAALAIGGFDPRYRYAMDYDLWLRLAEGGIVTTLDRTLAVRRMGTANVAARSERAQTVEAVWIRLRAMQRRRSLRGAGGLALPLVSIATPPAVKRARRRALGQAP